MSAEVREAAMALVQLLTGSYWNEAKIPGLDAKSASLGLRFGMAVALRHPEYAQAYIQVTGLHTADPLEERAIQGFIEWVPMEGETEDVVPSGE